MSFTVRRIAVRFAMLLGGAAVLPLIAYGVVSIFSRVATIDQAATTAGVGDGVATGALSFEASGTATATERCDSRRDDCFVEKEDINEP